jgi:hypothetical protein
MMNNSTVEVKLTEKKKESSRLNSPLVRSKSFWFFS